MTERRDAAAARRGTAAERRDAAAERRDAAGALRDPEAERRAHAPLSCRQRRGVVIARPAMNGDDEVHDDGALRPRELRQLALRPGPNTLTDLGRWPSEPASPAQAEPARFAAALHELCPPLYDAAQRAVLAQQILAASAAFDVDPMLLGALVYHLSECDPSRKNSWGSGLTMLNRGLFPAGLEQGTLRYTVREEDGSLDLRTLLFSLPASALADPLADPARNLYLAAALLRMYRDQCAMLDDHCASAPHRHYVSHFVWGDHVRGSGPEDAVLTARRRLIRYYRGDSGSDRTAKLGALEVVSPLDGPPRIVTSGLGEARDNGRRAHAGIDFYSRLGEPVRAIADGVVLRAGSDFADGRLVDIEPARAALISPHAMGPRGLFVELAHSDGYRSIYAHFASYEVRAGDRVRRGQRLGYVGRTGIRESDPHLHFGLFAGDQVLDPWRALSPLLFAPVLEARAAHGEAHAHEPRSTAKRPAAADGLR